MSAPPNAGCRLAERLFRFEDEDLRPGADLVARVAEHVGECAACRERFEDDARVAAALLAVPPIAPPPFAIPRRNRRGLSLLAAGAAAALSVAVAAAIFLREPAPGNEAAPAAAPMPAALPPGTTFTLTVSSIEMDRGRRSVVAETTRYAPGPDDVRAHSEDSK